MNLINQVEYEQKLALLNKAKITLKQKFVGIDIVIDQLFEYLNIWFLMPQILMRPLIVNLWGMTGVGKTDLIRSLVKELDIQDNFLEVELSGDRGYGWDSSVAEVFASRGLNAGETNIVLFDEIQKFRSIDDKGEEVKVDKFQDFWELLSDGKMSDKGRGKELLEMFYDSQWQKVSKEEAEAKKEEFVDSKIGIWQATRLKKLSPTKMSIMEISRLTYSEFGAMMEELQKENAFYQHLDYSRTLIIISGNLDEAYTDAKNVGDVEVDADIFHSITSKLNILHIKEALVKRFRPEQISRFGNIHLIYPSLSRASYELLISQKIDQIKSQLKEKFDLELNVDKSILELIYRNGVFPAQGVRPVLSSITEILECNLAKFIFEAVKSNFSHLRVGYSDSKKIIQAKLSVPREVAKSDLNPISTSKAKTINVPFVGRIDQIKIKENTKNLKAMTAVHESGHALLYVINFGLAPLQLKSNLASTSSYGFTFSHQIHLTKALLLKKIQTYLAGHLAEKIVFGEDKCSIGHGSDWREATVLAADFVRRYGFGGQTTSVVTSIMNSEAERLNTNIETSNQEIEVLLQQQLSLTWQILTDNKKTLTKLSQELFVSSSLLPIQVQTICNSQNLSCEVENENFVVYEDYVSGLGV